MLLMVSCKTRIISDGDVLSVDLLSSTEEITNLSDYINDIQVMKLDVDSTGYVRPEKILLSKGIMVILSEGQVYEFDVSGHYLGTVGRIGNGPGEYLHIADICVNESKDLIMCQNHMNQVLMYSLLTRQYIGIIDSGLLGVSSNAIMPFGKDGFVLLVNNPAIASDFDNEFNCLKCYDKNGHLIKEMLPREDFNIVFSMFPNAVQGPHNEYYLSYIPSSGKFYKMTSKDMEPVISLNFGSKSLPYRYAVHGDDNPWNKLEDIFESGYYKCISSLCETSEIMYCYAFGAQNQGYHFVINPDTGKGIRWKSSLFYSPMGAVASDEDYVYYVLDEGRDFSNGYPPMYEPDILRATIFNMTGIVPEELENPVIIKIRYSL